MYLSQNLDVNWVQKLSRYNRIANFCVDKFCLKARFFLIRHLKALTDDISDMKSYKRMVSKL